MGPHAFPFVLVDRPGPGRVLFRLTAGGALTRGGELPPSLGIEVLAQAAALASAASTSATGTPGGGPATGVLAGLDDVRFAEGLAYRPLAPGDTLEARVERAGAFGRFVAVRGELRRDDEPVVEAGLLLALDAKP